MNATKNEGQYLTFKIQGNGFGLPIDRVREIIGYEKPVTVPLMPKWVYGVINLRGASIPVIDLGLRFFAKDIEISRHTCIVIFSAEATGSKIRFMGLIVDSVSEVVSFGIKDLEESPDVGNGIRANFLNGIGKINNRFFLLLNIEKTLESVNKEEIEKIMATYGKKVHNRNKKQKEKLEHI